MFSNQGQMLGQLSMQHPIPLPVIDNRPTAFRQNGAAGLGLSRAPSGALQRIVATAGIVLDVIECRLQLRVPLLEPVKLDLDGRQTP